MTVQTDEDARSYGCSMGDGNPYDLIVIDVQSGEVMFLCVPCYIKVAMDMVTAMTDPDNANVQKAMAMAGTPEQAPMTSGKVRKRGHNAPAETDDPDLITVFDDMILADELPDDFR